MKDKDIQDALLMHLNGKDDEEIATYYTIWPCNASLSVFFDAYDQLRKTFKEDNCENCQAIFKPNELNSKKLCERCRSLKWS